MYGSLIEDAARLHGIPLALAQQLIGAESAGNPAATSPKGAMGLAQLMPGTARDLGVTDPYDSAQNVDAGMRYLAEQYKEFGSWPLALAAYNAGPQRVREYGGVPPFAETQAYVQKLMPYAQEAAMPMPPQELPPQMPPQAQQQPQEGLFSRLAMHPAFQMGLGILGANTGNYGAAGPALGQGALAGLQNWQQMQAIQAAMQKKQEPNLTDDMREYALAVREGYKGTFRDYMMEMKKAGASSVSVNTDSLGLKPKDRFGMERDLRSDFQSSTKTAQGILDAYQKWTSAMDAEGGIRDIAAVTAFAKTLDPESVVREAEFATILGASGLKQQFFTYLDRLKNGQMLPPEQLVQMDKVVRSLAQAARERLAGEWENTSRAASEYGLDPGRATGFASPEDIMRRYRFGAAPASKGTLSPEDQAELERLRKLQGPL